MRWLLRATMAVGVMLIFVAALLAAVAIHIGLPVARRTLIASLNGLLEDVVDGTIVIRGVESLSISGASGIHAEVLDPEGRRAVLATGASADWSALDVLHGLILGDTITVDGVHVPYAEVSLDEDPGGWRLAQTFASEPSEPTSSAGRPLHIDIDNITIGHVWTHGMVAGSLIDADIDDVSGRLHVVTNSGDTRIQLADARIRTRSTPYDLGLDAHVQGELAVEETLSAEGKLTGAIAQTPITVEGSYRDEVALLELDAGPVPPSALSRRFGWAPRAPAWLSLSARGPLDALDSALELRLATRPATSLHWRGTVDVREPALRGELEARNVDLRTLSAGAPRSDLDARADVALSLKEGKPEGNATLRLGAGSTVDGHALPDLTLRTRVSGERVEADADIKGHGITAQATAEVKQVEAGTAIDGTVTVSELNLAELPLPLQLTGTGHIEASADVLIGDTATRVDARAEGTLLRLGIGPMSAARVALDASVSGSLPSPKVSVEAQLSGLRTPLGGFLRGDVSAEGTAKAFDVQVDVSGGSEGILVVRAQADVSIGKWVSLDDVRVRASTLGGPLVGRVGRVAFGDALRVEDLVVDGPAGHVAGSLSTAPGRQRIDMEGRNIDLERVGKILDVPELQGSARFDVDLDRNGRGLDGKVTASFEDAQFRFWEKIGGRLDASLDGRDMLLRAAVVADHDAVVEIDADVSTDRPWLSPAALRRLTGEVRIMAAADLPRAQRVAEELGASIPLVVHGDAAILTTMRRDGPTDAPEVAVHLHGERLGAQPQTTQFLSRLEADDSLRWRVRGLVIDVLADVTEQGDADVELRLEDRHGRLLAMDATAELPYQALWHDHRELWRWSEWIGQVPIKMWAHTNRRTLSRLADLVDADDLQGEMKLEAWFEGTLRDPNAKIAAELYDARGELSPFDVPIDANLLATWDGELVDTRVALADPERKFAVAHVRVDADVPAIVLGVPASKPWQADAHVQLCAFPLDAVSVMAGLAVQGRAHGGFEISNLNTPDVGGTASLWVERLEVGNAVYPRASLAATIDRSQLTAEATIEQKVGGAELEARIPILWRAGLPAVGDGGGHIELAADDLRLAVVQPFVEEVIPELDGSLDGKVTLALGATPSVSGAVKLSDGRAQFADFGDTFTNVDAVFNMHENGRVETALRAKSGGGWVVARGRAVIKSSSRAAANVVLRVAEDAPIPVLVEGQYIGELVGEVNASLRLYDDRLEIEAEVPELLLELPRRQPADVQELKTAPHIRIGTYVEDERFVSLPLSPPTKQKQGPGMATLVRVTLGEDVRVVRGEELEVWLDGGVTLEVTDVMRAAGSIEVTSGELDLQGKTFEIQKAIVTFDGRPPIDPQIVATAAWQAPDGMTVYADYIGPVKSGTVKLRSDPPMDDSRILALLAFGDADYQFDSDTSEGGVGTAVGVGGSIAARGLNEALDDLTSLDLTARVDTSRTTAATELEWRIARQFAVSVAHVIGLPPPGEPPDRNYATIDWTFAHEWSLETAVGDRGSTTMDVIWSHAY